MKTFPSSSWAMSYGIEDEYPFFRKEYPIKLDELTWQEMRGLEPITKGKFEHNIPLTKLEKLWLKGEK